MKKLIALATVLALVVVLAVPVTAVNYAPDRPPWIYERQTHATPSGDDHGWVDEKSSPALNIKNIWSWIESVTYPYNSGLILIGFMNITSCNLDSDDMGVNDADGAGTAVEDRATSSR